MQVHEKPAGFPPSPAREVNQIVSGSHSPSTAAFQSPRRCPSLGFTKHPFDFNLLRLSATRFASPQISYNLASREDHELFDSPDRRVERLTPYRRSNLALSGCSAN